MPVPLRVRCPVRTLRRPPRPLPLLEHQPISLRDLAAVQPLSQLVERDLLSCLLGHI
jgi:hypothetical protein